MKAKHCHPNNPMVFGKHVAVFDEVDRSRIAMKALRGLMPISSVQSTQRQVPKAKLHRAGDTANKNGIGFIKQKPTQGKQKLKLNQGKQ